MSWCTDYELVISIGAHCADLQTPDPNNDPQWLVAQRDKEIKIIELWIAEYNAKLTSKVLDNKAP